MNTIINSLFSTNKTPKSIKLVLTGKKFKSDDWTTKCNFTARADEVLVHPDNKVLIGLGKLENPFFWAGVCEKLPCGTFCAPEFEIARTKAPLTKCPDIKDMIFDALVLGWALAHYNFNTYNKSKIRIRTLILPRSVDSKKSIAIATATFLTRDLINEPANNMTPEIFEKHAKKLAKQNKASFKVISGSALKKFPLLYAVGRGSANSARLVEMNWKCKCSASKNKDIKTLTLIGKGITFDSGGLNLKPGSNMKLMKKDMGGAANVLGLSYLIMQLNLRVNLRVIIPLAENMVSSNSYRPSDILNSRGGMTVEVGDTDAEGRLVLADALAYSGEKKSDLTIDMATLTGAARIAVGQEMVAYFSKNKQTAEAYFNACVKTFDPAWELPLYSPYKSLLRSPIADISSTPAGGPCGGAITAALFLGAFVDKKTDWMHIDLMAYNANSSKGRPKGGEMMGVRGLLEMLLARFGTA